MLSRSHAKRLSWSRGATLLEVLVSILLMSFGLLALAGMQVFALAAQKNGNNRAIASFLANDIAERIRVNPAGLAGAAYDKVVLTTSALPAEVLCSFPDCDTAQKLAQADLSAFLATVRSQLPLGGLVISRPVVGAATSTTMANIWIIWEESSTLNTTQDGTATSSESTIDNCPDAAKALATLPRCFYLKLVL